MNNKFELGEAVMIAEGRFKGICGSVVSVQILEPDGVPFYCVDAEDCGDTPIPGSALKSLKSVIGTKPIGIVSTPTITEHEYRRECLEKAIDIVCGDREKVYGKPEDNLGVIADLWTAYLTRVFGDVTEIDKEDVAVMMALLKIGRIAGKHFKADSMIDACGYLAMSYEVGMQKESERHES